VLSEGKVRATASHADITAELLTTAWRQVQADCVERVSQPGI
jgi:hypothetical protein